VRVETYCNRVERAWLQRLKLTCDELHLNNAFNYNLRRYMKVASAGGSGPSDRLQRRACDILSSLNVTSLSVATAELKILHTLMATEAETEIERKFQRRVEGSKAGAYTRPLFGATSAVFDTKLTLNTPLMTPDTS